MRSFLERIISLVDRREIKISEHGYDELINDDILIRDLIESIQEAQPVEFYPISEKDPAFYFSSLIPGSVLFIQSGG